jgi:hypothetical protein
LACLTGLNDRTSSGEGCSASRELCSRSCSSELDAAAAVEDARRPWAWTPARKSRVQASRASWRAAVMVLSTIYAESDRLDWLLEASSGKISRTHGTGRRGNFAGQDPDRMQVLMEVHYWWRRSAATKTQTAIQSRFIHLILGLFRATPKSGPLRRVYSKPANFQRADSTVKQYPVFGQPDPAVSCLGVWGPGPFVPPNLPNGPSGSRGPGPAIPFSGSFSILVLGYWLTTRQAWH